MLNHIYTLKLVVDKLQVLSACELVSIFSQESEKYIFEFDDGDENYFLEISIKNQEDAIFLRSNFAKARSNVRDYFEFLNKEILQEIKLIENERIIELTFIKYKVIVYLFGNGGSNILVIDKENTIKEAILDREILLGIKYEYPKREFKNINEFEKEITLREALNKTNLFLGNLYLKEFELLNSLNLSRNLSELDELELNNIYNLALDFKSKCLNSRDYYILNKNNRPFFSLIPLSNFELEYKFSDINKAIQSKISKIYYLDNIEKEKKQLKAHLDGIIRKNINTIKKIKELGDINERMESFKLMGELLMSQGDLKRKNIEIINLNDWNGNLIEIKLNSKLNLIENAQKYFEKVKNMKKESNTFLNKLPEAELKINEANKYLIELENISDLKELKQFKSKFIKEKKVNLDNSSLENKFRKIVIDENNILYIGKSASSNDELTQKFAKPNDLWFHARGVSGSHCVLKTKNNAKVSKEAIERSAEISAYYSQARGGSYVPVAYCLKKYVRKPKGANIGAVIMEKEEVIMVEPKLN